MAITEHLINLPTINMHISSEVIEYELEVAPAMSSHINDPDTA